jgi:hypothetical protein
MTAARQVIDTLVRDDWSTHAKRTTPGSNPISRIGALVPNADVSQELTDGLTNTAQVGMQAGRFHWIMNGVEFGSLDTNGFDGRFLQTGAGAVSRSLRAKIRERVSVADFGEVGNGIADDSAAIRAAVAEIVARGGGELWFTPGKTYKVWAADTDRLMDFRGATGIRVRGNGATIVSALVNSVAAAYCVDITSVIGFSVDGLNFTGGNTTLVPTGEQFIIGGNGTTNVEVKNLKVKNTQVGMNYGTGATDNNGLRLSNVIFERVYYPTNIYQTSNIKADYQAINCGRSIVLAAPIYNAEYSIDSQHGGPYSDIIISGYADSTKVAAYNTLANIRINYRTSGRFLGAGNQNTAAEGIVYIAFQQLNGSSAAMNMRDIAINIEAVATSDKPSNALTIVRYKHDGTGDGTNRGHTLRNLKISGVLKDWNNSQSNGLVLFSTETIGGTAMNWTGDTLENISLENLRIHGAPPTDAIYINGQGAVSGAPFVQFRNEQHDGAITIVNATDKWIQGLRRTATPTLTFGGGSTGMTYSVQTIQYAVSDGRCRGNIVVTLTAKGASTGAAVIGGLPHTVRNNNDSYTPIIFRVVSLTFTKHLQGYCDVNTKTVVLEDAGVGNMTDANFANATSLMIGFDYPIA